MNFNVSIRGTLEGGECEPLIVIVVRLFHLQNRELQIMRRLEHCNIVKLKYFFYSSGEKVIMQFYSYHPTTTDRKFTDSAETQSVSLFLELRGVSRNSLTKAPVSPFASCLPASRSNALTRTRAFL